MIWTTMLNELSFDVQIVIYLCFIERRVFNQIRASLALPARTIAHFVQVLLTLYTDLSRHQNRNQKIRKRITMCIQFFKPHPPCASLMHMKHLSRREAHERSCRPQRFPFDKTIYNMIGNQQSTIVVPSLPSQSRKKNTCIKQKSKNEIRNFHLR